MELSQALVDVAITEKRFLTVKFNSNLYQTVNCTKLKHHF
jgi:hypothetical protein